MDVNPSMPSRADLGCRLRCAQVQKNKTKAQLQTLKCEGQTHLVPCCLQTQAAAAGQGERVEDPFFSSTSTPLKPNCVFFVPLPSFTETKALPQKWYNWALTRRIGKKNVVRFRSALKRSLRELESPAVVQLLIYYQIKEQQHCLFFFSCHQLDETWT